MRENLKFIDGKSMWRWLVLALLLTSVVSQNFNEPKSVYRIEEVISSARNKAISQRIRTLSQSFKNADKETGPSKNRSLQSERLRFLSETLQIHTELALSNAPDLLPIRMQATGEYLKSRSQSFEEPLHPHS